MSSLFVTIRHIFKHWRCGLVVVYGVGREILFQISASASCTVRITIAISSAVVIVKQSIPPPNFIKIRRQFFDLFCRQTDRQTHTQRQKPEIEPGLNLCPVTRLNPEVFDPVTRPSLCCELRDYFDDCLLLVSAFCQKYLVYETHKTTKISNIVHLLSIEK